MASLVPCGTLESTLSDADAVFDGNAGTIGRAAEVALNDGSRVVEEKHFEDLPEGYPIG